MANANITDALEYSKTLIGIPYRWYIESTDIFHGDDKFWCENIHPPTSLKIISDDKSIVCTGLINLMRRKNGLTIPGLNGNIKGKYKELYTKYPGGTGAWYLYLQQRKRLQKLDIKINYPQGTLLIARFKDNNNNQGHVAVVYNNVDNKTTINDQLIIHSCPDIPFKDKENKKNHGSVKVEQFNISNNKWKKDKKIYYTYICLPENWLELD